MYAEEVLKISPKYCISLSKDYIKSTKDFIKALYNLGYINKEIKEDDIFNFKFVNEIHPEPEHFS